MTPTLRAVLRIGLVLSLPAAVLPAAETPPETSIVGQAVLGKHLYRTYCASCHGPKAHGDGPVAAYLVVPPPNLLEIRQRREGEFPAEEITRIVDGRELENGHGSKDMPVWGDAFTIAVEEGDVERQVRQKIADLVEYLRSIQE